MSQGNEPDRTLDSNAAPDVLDWKRHVWSLLLALVVAIVARYWWLNFVDTQPVTDFDWYFERAVSIVQGHGYAIGAQKTAYWPVGYPAVLATLFYLFGATVATGKALNCCLTVLIVALSWVIAFKLFRSPWVAFLTALVLAIHPAYLAYSGILASEPLYTFLGLLGIWTLTVTSRIRWLPTVAAGLAFGVETLVRPQAVLLPLIAIACLALYDGERCLRGKSVRTLAVAYAVVVIVLAPWMFRNLSVFGQPVFVSTNGGDNLLIGNTEKSTGRYMNPDSLGYDFTGLNEAQRDKKASKAALESLSRDPSRFFELGPTKLSTTFLSGTDSPYWAFQTEKGHMKDPGTGADKPQFKWFQKYSEVATAAVFWSFVAGTLLSVLALKRLGRLPILGLALIAYTALLSLVFFGNPRFVFSVVPFMAMYGASGLVALASFFRTTAVSQKS